MDKNINLKDRIGLGKKSRHNIVKLNATSLERAGIQLSPKTFINWRLNGSHPGLVVKIANRLFVDVDMWDKIVDRAMEEEMGDDEF
jgi:hypothetical protein